MKRYYIGPISWGLGDLIVSLPAVHGLIRSGVPTTLVTRSSMQEGLSERISGLCGTIRESELAKTTLKNGESYFNLRDHSLQKDYWWGSPEFERDYPGFCIDDILSTICIDLGIAADMQRREPLQYQTRPESQDKVILLPGSDGTYKCWPSKRWQSLVAELETHGIACIVVGQPEHSQAVQELIDAGLSWQPSPQLTDALDLVSSARAVVGIDTGLLHLAAHQGIPTVGLYRNSPIYVHDMPHFKYIAASACSPDCIKSSVSCAYNELTDFITFTPRSWTCSLKDEERCMASIDHESVMEKLLTLLATAGAST